MSATSPAQAALAAPAGGQLFRAIERIDAIIARKKLDRFKARGEIALRAGFAFSFIDAETPDDPVQLAKLEAAAYAVLGEAI